MREFPRFVGTAKDVADGLEEWFTGHVCDGFVVAATHLPGGYEDFVRMVVPELQRRGLHQKDYKGPTLRENLGLPNRSLEATIENRAKLAGVIRQQRPRWLFAPYWVDAHPDHIAATEVVTPPRGCAPITSSR